MTSFPRDVTDCQVLPNIDGGLEFIFTTTCGFRKREGGRE